MSGKGGALSLKPTQLPARFRPRFAWTLDRRCTAVRELAADLVELWQDLGGVEELSVQKRALCDRVVFLRRQTIAYESAVLFNLARSADAPARELPMTAGEYTNAVNILLGLLRTLGLERKARTVATLRQKMGGGP